MLSKCFYMLLIFSCSNYAMKKEESKTFCPYYNWNTIPREVKGYTFVANLSDHDIRECSLINKEHYAIAQSIIEQRKKEQCEQRCAFLTSLRDLKFPILAHINFDKAIYTLKNYNTNYIGNPFKLKKIASSIAWNNTNSICSFIAINKNPGYSIFAAKKNSGDCLCSIRPEDWTYSIHEIPFQNTGSPMLYQPFFTSKTNLAILQHNETEENRSIHLIDINTEFNNYGIITGHYLYFNVDDKLKALKHFFEYPLLIKKYILHFDNDTFINRNPYFRSLSIDKITIPGFSSKYLPILKELIDNEGCISGEKKYSMSNDQLLTWARLFYTLGNIPLYKEYAASYKSRTIQELPVTLRTIDTRDFHAYLSYKPSIENGHLDAVCKACTIADSNQPLRSFLAECFKIIYKKNNRDILLEVYPAIQKHQKAIHIMLSEPPYNKANRFNKNHIYLPNNNHIFDVDCYVGTHDNLPSKIALLTCNDIAQKVVLYSTQIPDPSKKAKDIYSNKTFIEEKSYTLPSYYTAESLTFDPYYDDDIINVYMQPELFDFLRIPIIRINTKDSTHTITHTLHKQLFNPITLVNYYLY